ncbi:type II toxin-antitoxin system VapC family toxin [Isoptericola dokdonensis]|jgi:predicted nucleic acid-binding protein|uniref:Ribonuclease VapC n=1 Tax=Isoptericola dokdonensis DS-3 TaxID=1300344 RepID=A0A161IFA3_9MICO|nr:type II toxin-antitoxin system VapC family toxin [Isoptericola dokdonensis]ANC32097.1 Toxin FitB [Isoptericola dokdonensis DS-3]
MSWLVDTNVLSELTRRAPDRRVLDWVAAHADDLVTAAPVVAELLYGVARLPAGRRRDALSLAVVTLLEPFRGGRVLPFDEHAAVELAAVRVARERRGMPVGDVDLMIAATCRAHDVPLVTRNVQDFVGTGVQVVDPWQGP